MVIKERIGFKRIGKKKNPSVTVVGDDRKRDSQMEVVVKSKNNNTNKGKVVTSPDIKRGKKKESCGKTRSRPAAAGVENDALLKSVDQRQ